MNKWLFSTLDDSCDAATSLRLLASNNPRSAEIMIRNGLCSVFDKILEQGSMRVQAEVACTISVLASSFPESQKSFHMKAMAAKALKELAKGNSTICKDSCITAVAEQVSHLRHSAFKRKSPIFKAIVNQTHRLTEENGDTVLLIPYITLIGNLARAFRASDTSMIEQLVKLLGHQDPEKQF
ncbi:unnamed protein product [Arabis nemorensis]|uniref:Uncharacterized protein n=1 Tax=Arabis nemorensis TaxID=586526 RepID=A0A565BPM0_9BRAS|nr:unnamed protein product [Arabis nemorensis]